MVEYICRICGFEYSSPTWFEYNEPSYDICICCSSQFGLDDTHYDSVIDNRKEWLEKGAVFNSKKNKPNDYNLEENLNKILIQWK